MATGPGGVVVLTVVVLLSMVVGFAFRSDQRDRNHSFRLLTAGERVRGRITAVAARSRVQRGLRISHASRVRPFDLSFPLPDGTEVTRHYTAPIGFFHPYEGREVTVRYLAADPEDYLIEESTQHRPFGPRRVSLRSLAFVACWSALAVPVALAALGAYDPGTDALRRSVVETLRGPSPWLGSAFTCLLLAVTAIPAIVWSGRIGYGFLLLLVGERSDGVVTDVWKELVRAPSYGYSVRPFAVRFPTASGDVEERCPLTSWLYRPTPGRRVTVSYRRGRPYDFRVVDMASALLLGHGARLAVWAVGYARLALALLPPVT